MIRLEDTSGSAVAAAITHERNRQGSPATGMVLTLLILADEEFQADATAAAVSAARQHPMRIVTLVPRPGKTPTRLDAEISVGGDDGPGEVAVLRLRGDLAQHANSVAIPLLLPDTPVVAYWPHDAPAVPADDPIGRHAQCRITDSATASDPARELSARSLGYRPGDSDLAWTRLTPWRSALAAALDQPCGTIRSVRITADGANPSATLLAAWLGRCLSLEAEVVASAESGISEVLLGTDSGEIRLSRPEGSLGVLSRPGIPDSRIAIARRDLAELLSEDLRRLDPDDVYGKVITGIDNRQAGS